MPKSFPKKPCRFQETTQTIAARDCQRKMWNEYLEEIVLKGHASSSMSRKVSFITRPRLMSVALPLEEQL